MHENSAQNHQMTLVGSAFDAAMARGNIGLNNESDS